MSDVVVGVTGGVASGKSEVTRRFEALGISVVDADVAARAVVEPGSEGLVEVVAAFGQEVLSNDGGLDRPAMRRRIYEDADARRRLEGIVHPRVRAWMRARLQAAQGPYAIAAVPLLAESDPANWAWLARVLVVDVPESIQLARLRARDGVDADLARRMLDAQVGRAQRLAIADDIIVNDGPLAALDAQVAALDARYRWLAAQLTTAATTP